MGVFSNKEESQAKAAQGVSPTNQFCEGTVITGEVKSKNDIRLDGTINGNVFSESKVVIGQKGVVEGELKCQNADISGFVKGVVQVKELLFLKSTSEIQGDIAVNKLVVEAGARFNGSCSMGGIQTENGKPTNTKKEAV